MQSLVIGFSEASLISLIVFLLTSGIFIIADAEFLAVIQVLVYVGAVSVVILFGVMLTRRTLRGSTEDV